MPELESLPTAHASAGPEVRMRTNKHSLVRGSLFCEGCPWAASGHNEGLIGEHTQAAAADQLLEP